MKEDIIQLSIPTPFAVGDVHAYILKGEAVTLVDCGPMTEEAEHAFVAQLQEHRLSIDDIDQVVLTHHHADHVGLLNLKKPHVRVIGHELNEPYISQDPVFKERQIAFMERFFQQLGVPLRQGECERIVKQSYTYSCTAHVDDVIKEGDRLKGHEHFFVMETPGHAQSHLSFLDETTGHFIGGDLLLTTISSNPLMEAPFEGEERQKSLLQYKASLNRLLHLPIKTIYPGHGELITSHHELIEERFKKQEKRANTMYQLLKRKEMTAFHLCRKLFPVLYEEALFLTMSETVGQLDVLLEAGQIEEVQKDGILYYRAN
ncbi:MBL fold metallo-hydrolase [Bacillus pumilus]|uniref:MBL fold metallo-hydrolase n=1 Tax=Bacillus pumilus TaxID=1408 RepID=A0AAE3WLU0_BACPU|nr:MBL fold metallo-hydrolase [Bacillus pumilus]MDR4250006.1 MBL fold metallo-hydrolase [Bacillus pumilus]